MNMKRMRGRNHRPGNGGGGGSGFRNQQNGIPLNRNHVFDSSGPEMRVRGTAQQLHEKYIQMARDASSNGDRVTGEAYYQHAEHYFRIISAINLAQNPNGQPAPNQPQNGNNGYQDYQQRAEPAEEPAAEPRYQEPRYQEPRYQEPRVQQEPRQADQRPQQRYQERRPQNSNNGNNGNQPEQRPQELRQEERPAEARPAYEPRREQRNYEPRPKPEFQPRDRYRPETPVADTRIDISSALEAELTAAVATPAEPPVTKVAEARAIPIVPDAPPAAEIVKVPRPRGRPRLAKNEPKDAAE